MAKRKGKDELRPVGMTDEHGDDGSSKSLDLVPPAPPTLGSAPTPAEAETAAKKEDPAAAAASEAPARLKPSVPLRVFAAVSGIKPDQFQAFARYAAREEMRPCPVTEWKEHFEAFLKKPVR